MGGKFGPRQGLLRTPLGLVPEARPDERLREVGLRAACDRNTTERGTPTPHGREALSERRVRHDPDDGRVVTRCGIARDERDRHGEGGKPVEIVDRAVDRVDHPAEPARRTRRRRLLAEESVIRPRAHQPRTYERLDLTIRFGDDIDG